MANVHTETAGSCCSCECSSGHSHHNEHPQKAWKTYLPSIVSFVMLATGIVLDHFVANSFFGGYVRLTWYILAYLPVGWPVMKEAAGLIIRKDFFNEFTLMTIATLGAFFIGEYPEGVGVMLFYSIGELFQASAVNKAKGNIKALLDIRPDSASVYRNGEYQTVSPATVQTGEKILVKAGEKIPLDGIMLSPQSSFNTSALTGESKPKTIRQGETVLAGMLNLDKVIEIETTKAYEDSSLAKILAMVQDATSRKAKTELLIRKFARIYTPAVFFLAVAITVIPYFFVSDYVFQTWLYRALVFLVISCPCALVISIPLGYFGGIGAASRNGILFKGANYLDIMPKLTTIVMDKTGTLTKGVFNVQEVITASALYDAKALINFAAAIESKSNHPIANAIQEFHTANKGTTLQAGGVEEIAGHGLKGVIDGKTVLAGNSRLMNKFGIPYNTQIDSIPETVVIVAIGGAYAGYIIIADEIKEDAAETIRQLHNQHIRTVMLSGDKSSLTQRIAEKLGIDKAFGDLLPEDKVRHVEEIKKNPQEIIAFVGDGINDAPVLALSDVGIAMGGIGSDAAIEIADVVIQTDQPSKLSTAIRIAKATKAIVVQNIVMSLTIKVLVMLLGALGIGTMWGAVFADVGVALLAILNSVRILKKEF